MATVTFKTINLGRLAYLRDLLQEYQPTRTLRSSASHLLHQSYTPTSVSSHAFSVAAPTVRNQLTVNTRTASTPGTFRARLKTELMISRWTNLPTATVIWLIYYYQLQITTSEDAVEMAGLAVITDGGQPRFVAQKTFRLILRRRYILPENLSFDSLAHMTMVLSVADGMLAAACHCLHWIRWATSCCHWRCLLLLGLYCANHITISPLLKIYSVLKIVIVLYVIVIFDLRLHKIPALCSIHTWLLVIFRWCDQHGQEGHLTNNKWQWLI